MRAPAPDNFRLLRLATAAGVIGLSGLFALASNAATPARDRLFPKPAELSHIQHIVIDPGHGGDNLGALGYHATQEKALTLEVSKFITAFIQRHSNVRVTMTRHVDRAIALRERPRQANALKADALISLHCNASPNPKIQGMEVWFLDANASAGVVHELVRREEGLPERGAAAVLPWTIGGILSEMRYAAAHRRSQLLAHALAKGLKRGRPGARFRGVRQAPFGVLKEALMAAVVLEIGYITHPKEGRALLEHQAHLELARGVLLGLVEMDRLVGQQERGRNTTTGGPPAKRASQPAPKPASSK